MLNRLDVGGWELYHVAQDPAECHNLAAQYPDKLRELVTRWYTEAGKYQVLPLDATLTQRFSAQRPHVTKDRDTYTYYPNLSEVPIGNTPPVFNRPHSITARVSIPAGGAEGVLLAHGGIAGGYTFFMKNKKLYYIHNYCGLEELEVVSEVDVPEGDVTLRYEFEPTGKADVRQGKGTPGHARLYIDGALVGNRAFHVTTPLTFGIEGLSCGYDFGEAVTPRYQAPFTFTGTIHAVTVDLSGELIEDHEADLRSLMARQ
jgi:arylsulfatase